MIFLLFTQLINADEEIEEDSFMKVGYYKVVDSVLQIPSLQFKETFYDLCFVKYCSYNFGRKGYNVKLLEGIDKTIYLYESGNIEYNSRYYLSNKITPHNNFEFNAEFNPRKGDNLLFLEKNRFYNDVTRKVVLTYLGKDLKKAVKKMK